MFHYVCEFAMNNFVESTPNAPFSFDQVAYGTRGAEGEIQLFSKNVIYVMIFYLQCKVNLAKLAEYFNAAKTGKIV